MLPNHAPLTIAERFGTLAAMYPGRIDLGLLERPHVIAGVNVIAAETMRAAQEQLQGIRRRRAVSLYGRQLGRSDLDMTDEQADQLLGGGAAPRVDEMLTYTAVGTQREVQDYLDDFLRHTAADELMVAH